MLTGLLEMDPAEARWRTDLLAALNGQAAGRMIVRAAFVSARPPTLTWFACVDFAFAVEIWAGERSMLTPGDAIGAVSLLEKAEPLLRLVEYALGIEIEPEDLRGEVDLDRAWIRIDGHREGRIAHRLYLALPWRHPVVPAAAPFAPELLAGVPVAAHLAIAGPRISPHDAADLSDGDLLLLGPGPLRATLHALDRPHIGGKLDLAAGTFTTYEKAGAPS